MPPLDHKTKDFLAKADLLINKGLVKNDAEIIKTLNWNKSVMSSVRNGAIVVPQHIYNKFKEVYAEKLIEQTQSSDWKDEQISLLKENNLYLREQIEFFKQKITAIEKSLTEAKHDQYLIASVQQAFQEWWIENFHPKNTTPAEVRKIIGRKSLESLKSFQKEGIALH